MRRTNLIIVVVSIATLTACAKAGKEVAEELGLVEATCGADGARIQANIGGNEFCADGTIVAVCDGTSATVTGIGLLGNTLTLQMDSVVVGTHVISEGANAMLFLSAGTPYVTVGDSAGRLVILEHTPADRRLKAEFECTVFNEMNGQVRPISGSVDVTYSQGE